MTIRPLSLSKLHKFIKYFISFYVKGNLDILLNFLFDSIIVKTHKGLYMISLGLIQKGVWFLSNVDLGFRVAFLMQTLKLLREHLCQTINS